MKKLIIAACAVAFAAGVQAASITWGTSGAFYDTDGDAGGWNTVAAGTTAYFVFANSYAQADLVADFAAGTVNNAKLTAINSGTVGADGTVAKVTGSSTTLTGSQAAYVVLFEGTDHMFISDSLTKGINELMGSTYTFDESLTGDIWADNGLATAGYSAPGWYSASVPEPTSGLLMLLGMAGLALRRRRA